MRAAVAESLGLPLVIKDVATPDIGPTDVLLEVRACGICATDLKIVDALAAVLPLVPGHEPVGVVAAVGDRVHGLRVGERVGVHAFFACGECTHCAAGEDEACVMGFGALAGLGQDGGYAEYMRLPAARVIPLPPGLDFVDAAPLFCAGLTSYAALRNAGVRPGHRVVVIGVGGLGHLAISIAVALGAQVYAVTASPDKAADARARGAVVAGDARAVADELLRAGGADVALNTSDALEPLAAIVPAMAKQGAVVLVAGAGGPLPITPEILGSLQLRVIGSFFGSAQDMRDLLALAHKHAIRPHVERYQLEDVNAAHDRLRANGVRYRAVIELKSS
jgi:alcohol dehydrogenase, propanol-preferring